MESGDEDMLLKWCQRELILVKHFLTKSVFAVLRLDLKRGDTVYHWKIAFILARVVGRKSKSLQWLQCLDASINSLWCRSNLSFSIEELQSHVTTQDQSTNKPFWWKVFFWKIAVSQLDCARFSKSADGYGIHYGKISETQCWLWAQMEYIQKPFASIEKWIYIDFFLNQNSGVIGLTTLLKSHVLLRGYFSYFNSDSLIKKLKMKENWSGDTGSWEGSRK